MNNWIILGIVVGILIVGGIAMVSALSTNSQYAAESASTSVNGCGFCNGKCTSTSGCGASTCGATNGGTCTCGRR